MIELMDVLGTWDHGFMWEYEGKDKGVIETGHIILRFFTLLSSL